MTFEKGAFYSRGTLSSGAVSVSLNDSWTGRKLLVALGGLPPQRLSPEGFDVSEYILVNTYNWFEKGSQLSILMNLDFIGKMQPI